MPSPPPDPTPSPVPSASLHLDGLPALHEPGRPPLRLSPKVAALAALLSRQGAMTRAQLATLLHAGGAKPETARPNLRQLLFSQAAVIERLVEQQGDSLRLRAALAVQPAPDVASEAAASPLLGDIRFDDMPAFQHWLDDERLRDAHRRAEALAAAASAHEQAGRLAAALQLALQLVAEQAASEHAHRRVMRLHYLRGDRAAALAAFDHCEQVLKHELSARPGEETLALLRQIESAEAAPTPGAGRPIPATVLRPPRLVGRDAEWLALHAAWRRGDAAVVLGEGGMGKTRLLTDFARAQGLDEQRVLLVTARPGDERVPYAVLSRWLRVILAAQPGIELPPGVKRELCRLLPELGDAEPLAGDLQKARFVNSLDVLLAAAAAQGLAGMVLDDLHFADGASLEMALHLTAVPGLRWLVAGRCAELSAQAQAFITELGDALHAETLTLGPLTEPQVREFVASLDLPELDQPDLAQALFRRSGGSPLFLIETLKALWTQREPAGAALALRALPPSGGLSQLIERRLVRLSAEAVRLARCAAVAGQDFSADLATHVMGVLPLDLSDAWAELQAAQVLRDDGFAHDLVYEAALASVPQPIARQLHRNIAAFLERHGAPPAREAAHWEQAAAWPEAGAAWLRAAEWSRRQVRPVEQAQQLESAAACFGQAGRLNDRFEALLQRLSALGQLNLGERLLEAVAEAEAAATTQDQQLRAAIARAELQLYRADPKSLDASLEGYELARQAGRTDLMVRFALPMAGLLGEARRADEAVTLLLPMREWTHTHLNEARRCQFENALALALDQANRLDEALLAWDRSLAISRAAGESLLVSQSLANKGSTLAKMGLVREAAVLARQGLDLMLAQPEAQGRPHMTQCTLGHRLRDLGRYAEAIELLEAALASFTASGVRFWRHMAQDRLSQLWLQLGQPGRAKPLLDDDPEGLPLGLQVMRWVHRADLARHVGGDALTPMRQALVLMGDRHDDIYYRIASLFACAIVPADEAEALAIGLTHWARSHHRFGVALAGHVRAAGAALAQGAPARALPQVEAAMALSQDHVPDSFYLPELWSVASRVHQALGQTADAGAALQAGRRWIEQVASTQVPAPFRESFLQRNPINRDLMLRALQVGADP